MTTVYGAQSPPCWTTRNPSFNFKAGELGWFCDVTCHDTVRPSFRRKVDAEVDKEWVFHSRPTHIKTGQPNRRSVPLRDQRTPHYFKPIAAHEVTPPSANSYGPWSSSHYSVSAVTHNNYSRLPPASGPEYLMELEEPRVFLPGQIVPTGHIFHGLQSRQGVLFLPQGDRSAMTEVNGQHRLR